MINGVNGTNYFVDNSTRKAPSSKLGKEEFLSMLVTQLRYQDPMDPMKGTEFAAQLAQFSSVEQLTNLNDMMEQSLSSNSAMAQSINNALATTLIGKSVRSMGNSITVTGAESYKFGYNLPQGANTVTVKIRNAAGAVVRTLKVDETSMGDHTLTWDGKSESGAALPNGKYSFSVEALDGAGTEVSSSTYTLGAVTAVRYKSDGTYFVVDGVEIPLSEILEIMQG